MHLPATTSPFEPTRAAGLARLDAFARGGPSRYASRRNHDAGREPLATRLREACAGRTGIDGFDDWVRELVDTGYLHNHARMWFASIWTHTLRLPWELGADFFLRHLLDGDPASNTLSWRWVVGLQTPGKVYLARADNVAKYTGGRYAPRGLAGAAEVPELPRLPAPQSLRELPAPPCGPALLLLTEEDLHPESLVLDGVEVVAVAAAHAAPGRSPLPVAPAVLEFTARAQADALARLGDARAGIDAAALPARSLPTFEAGALAAWCAELGVSTIVAPCVPVGPARECVDALRAALHEEGVTVYEVRRPWDELAWPHARRGFFPFAERIPALLRETGLR